MDATLSDFDDSALFCPVPIRARHDGWTAERQYAFVQGLIVYGAVKQAAASVGMTPK